MFSFSLTRTEPKGQNSQTCMLRRDSRFPHKSAAFFPLHSRVQCLGPSAGSVLLSRSPETAEGQCHMSHSAGTSLSSQKGHSGQQRQHRITGTDRYFLSVWYLKTAYFKFKNFINIYLIGKTNISQRACCEGT